jgi:hypothetical protein
LPNPHLISNNKVGEITAYVRGEIKADANEARVVRKRKAQERYLKTYTQTLTLTLTLALTYTLILTLALLTLALTLGLTLTLALT